MIEETKTIELKLPEIFKEKERHKLGMMDWCKLHNEKEDVYETISEEFNNYFSKERVGKYNGNEVARTSFMSVDLSSMRFKDSTNMFEMFEMENIQKGEIVTNYTKGKVLERMTLIIKFI